MRCGASEARDAASRATTSASAGSNGTVGDPQAGETLTKYADLLRVGQLSVNGRPVVWNTRAANCLQLERFCAAFTAEVKRLPAARSLEDDVLVRAAHLVCKALSINYVLCELMTVIRSRLRGKQTDVYSIKGSGPSSPGPEYGVDILENGAMRAYVRWTGHGNIQCYDSRTAKVKVKGTLSHVETSFPLSPEPGFTPTYSMKVELQRSPLAWLTSRLGPICSAAGGGGGRPSVAEMQPDDPFVVCEEESGSTEASSECTDECRGARSGCYDEGTVYIRTATWDQE